jgi:hypothetical protein
MPESRSTPSAAAALLQSHTQADIPQNSPPFPIPKNNAEQTPQLHADLSLKQQDALNRLFAGQGDQYICQTLKIDRKTLYNWKHRHPGFMAEVARRNQDIWQNLRDELRELVIDSIKTFHDHLHLSANPTIQFRAARTLMRLVDSPRLTPTAPTSITGVLDRLLAANSKTSAPCAPVAAPAAAAAVNNPTFTDAQRQALLDLLLTENAAIESESDALFESRRRRPSAPTPAQPTDSTNNPLAVAPQVHDPATNAFP